MSRIFRELFVLFSISSLLFVYACGKQDAEKPKEEKATTKPKHGAAPAKNADQAIPPQDANFRSAKWGMTKAEVQKSETNSPVHDEGNVLGYQGRVQGMDCLIVYIFAKDQLVRAKYVVQQKHSNQNDYINDYDSLRKTLTDKYGTPQENKTIWKNDLYKDDVQHYGMAVSMGHLMYFSRWDSEPTEISLILHGDNFEITLAIEYSSKALKGLEEQAKKEEAASEL